MATTSSTTVALARGAARQIGRVHTVRRRPQELAAGERAGAWRIERALGKGGMASVYAVIHIQFGKRAALKLAHGAIIGPQFTADTFFREARVVHMIDHPSVPDVFAIGSHDKRPYLVMEQLAGETLGDRLDRGPLERDEAIALLLELCEVLTAAHAAGVVHRDLKLDNVFLLASPLAQGRRLKLLDWGVAVIIGEPDPLQGVIAGTLTYVAPEEIRGDRIHGAADIYSLGVLAYHLLLGTPPFTAGTDLELIRQHLQSPPPPPSSLWSEIPPDLAALLVSMLSKYPDDRPLLSEIAAVLRRVREQLAKAPADVLGRPRVAFTGKRLIGATIAAASVIAAALAAAGM